MPLGLVGRRCKGTLGIVFPVIEGSILRRQAQSAVSRIFELGVDALAYDYVILKTVKLTRSILRLLEQSRPLRLAEDIALLLILLWLLGILTPVPKQTASLLLLILLLWLLACSISQTPKETSSTLLLICAAS